MDKRRCEYCGYVFPTEEDRVQHQVASFLWGGTCSPSEGDDE